MRTLIRGASSALVFVLLFSVGLGAQVTPGWNPAQFQMTRPELQELLDRYEAVLASPGYSASLKESARRSAQLIRTRLETGDFRVGDRIVLEMQTPTGPQRDTLVVESGPAISMVGMGRIPLEGVLRSELEGHLTEELARYVREPSVEAHSLIRLAVQGAVGRPGFYVFPSEMLISDLIMSTGGPSANADLDDMRVTRRDQVIVEPEEMRRALDEGRSLDQLGLQAGDQIHVGADTPSSIWPRVIRVGLVVASTLLFGIRVF